MDRVRFLRFLLCAILCFPCCSHSHQSLSGSLLRAHMAVFHPHAGDSNAMSDFAWHLHVGFAVPAIDSLAPRTQACSGHVHDLGGAIPIAGFVTKADGLGYDRAMLRASSWSPAIPFEARHELPVVLQI